MYQFFIILLKSITIICLKQIFVLQKCFVSHLFIIYIMEQRNSAGWPYSILDDEYLAENVIDYVVSEGEQFVLPNRPGFSYPVSDSIWIKMQSISESCYQVFDQMIKQIRSDGGTFSPRPTSVKSNIDNGAYGIFRVSAISEIYFYKKHRI